MKVLVEEQVVTKVRIALQALVVTIDGPQAIFVAQEDAAEAPRKLT